MKEDKRLTWLKVNKTCYVVDNKKGESLGRLEYERVGAHMHWCWYQEEDIRMSPGCLQEVRDKQKELLKNVRNRKN